MFPQFKKMWFVSIKQQNHVLKKNQKKKRIQTNSITGLRGIGWAKGKLSKSGLCFTSKSTDV